ncbi:biotin/lipoyl-containing protein, partial [Rhodococcus oxybenzonivorans]
MTTEQLEGTTVRMPALGENVDEGTITRWLKQPGDRIEAEEPLLEVATDKVDTEIPSPVGGILQRILADEDDVVTVGAELAVITDSSDGAAAAPTNASPAPPVQAPPAVSAPTAAAAPPVSAPTVPPTPKPEPTPEPTLAPPAQREQAASDDSVTEKLPRIRRTIAQRMVESLQTSAQLTTVLEVDVTAIARLRAAHKDDFLARTGL